MQIQILPGVRPGQDVQAPSRPLSLRPGDVLRGEVVSSGDGQVNIRLSDGALLRAQVATGVELRPGEQVQLTVSGQDDGQILMRLTQGEEVAIERPALSRQDAQSAQVYTLMRQMSLPATKENFARVQELMQRFPALDERGAVLIAANIRQLPPEGQDASLRALAQAVAGEGRGIAAPIESLLAALQAEGDAPQAGSAEEAGRLPQGLPQAQDQPAAQALARFLQQAAPEGYRALAAQGRVQDAAALLRVVASLPPEEVARALEAFAAQISGDAPQGGQLLPALQRATQALQAALEQAPPPQGQGQEQTARVLPQEAQAFLERLFTAQPAGENAPGSPQAPATPGQAQAPPSAQPPAAQLPAAPQGAEAPQSGQAGQPATPAAPGQAAPPTAETALPQAAPSPQATQASQAAQPNQAPQPQGAAQSAPPAALLARAEALFARLDGGDPAGELQRVVTTLLRELGQVRQALEAEPGRAATAYAVQADARAQALPQIAQFHYLQLPVEFRGQRQSAELYVMARPGRSAGDKEEFTILLALETQNLGRVETVVRAREKEVSLTFRMKEGSEAEAIRSGFDGLRQSIQETGYLLREAIVSRLDQPVTPQTFEEVLGIVQKLSALDVTV